MNNIVNIFINNYTKSKNDTAIREKKQKKLNKSSAADPGKKVAKTPAQRKLLTYKKVID